VGVSKKILTITLDNASTNDSYVRVLKQTLNIKKILLCKGEFFHLYCCAHILNLIVQDGLKRSLILSKRFERVLSILEDHK
jgi:hypothetical protein